MASVKDGDGTRQLTAAQQNERTDMSVWLLKDVSIPQQAQELFERYSGIPSAEVQPWVLQTRDEAFATWPYPCIGYLYFLDLTTSKHHKYPEVLQRLKDGQTFLDAGCCLGQDIRKLLFDGAPSSAAMYGVDLEPGFFELGKKLFRDGDRLQSKLYAADLVRATGTESVFEDLGGKMDVISIQNVFHLFDLNDQKSLAKHLVTLSTPKPGSLILGCQFGSIKSGSMEGFSAGASLFFHNSNTWQRLWNDVGHETGTKWQVESFERDLPARFKTPNFRMDNLMTLWFSAARL